MKLNDIKWLLNYAKKSKKYLLLYCLTGLLMVVVWIILPILLSRQTLALTSGAYKDLYHIALAIFFIHFFYNILKVVISYFALKFITETYRNLHLDISKKFINTSISKIKIKSSGYYIERLTDDTINISDFFIRITDDIIDILINIGSLITIFILNKYIFLLYLYFLILLFLIKKAKINSLIKKEKQKKENVESLMNSNIEMIRGIEDIKVLNLKHSFLKILNGKIKQFGSSLIQEDNTTRFYRFIYSSALNIFRFLLIAFCIYLIIENQIAVSVALIAINYESNIFELLDYTESILNNIKKFKLCASRVQEILHNKNEDYDQYGSKDIKSKEINLKINNVTFGYQKNKIILENINMEFLSKKSIGIVGISGAGKTSIFNLLTKLYLPDNGNITMNDININEFNEEALKNTISIVNQHPFLFGMSIKENLKLANKNASDKDIENACKMAEIHEDIMKLPNGYATIIEEGGSNFSGGQKQRLAIARVILKNTPIILFDEATSSLDNHTQTKILLALEKLKGKHTVITIAHRLSTIMNCDYIYVLDHKKIVAKGTHEELIKQSKVYQNLYYKENN